MRKDCISNIIHEKNYTKDSMMKSALSIFVRKNIHQFQCKNDNSQPILVASSIKLTDYSVKEMKVDKMSKSE